MILVSASCSCFTLTVPMCEVYCVHGIHTSCMGSPFSIVHAEWSLAFWSFWIMRKRWVRTALNYRRNNNSNTLKTERYYAFFLQKKCVYFDILFYLPKFVLTHYCNTLNITMYMSPSMRYHHGSKCISLIYDLQK